MWWASAPCQAHSAATLHALAHQLTSDPERWVLLESCRNWGSKVKKLSQEHIATNGRAQTQTQGNQAPRPCWFHSAT